MFHSLPSFVTLWRDIHPCVRLSTFPQDLWLEFVTSVYYRSTISFPSNVSYDSAWQVLNLRDLYFPLMHLCQVLRVNLLKFLQTWEGEEKIEKSDCRLYSYIYCRVITCHLYYHVLWIWFLPQVHFTHWSSFSGDLSYQWHISVLSHEPMY